jgi:hypothetical protein
LAGLTKFAGTTTYLILGHNVSAYPRIYADATTLRLYGTATTYFSATSSNQLYAYAAGNQALAIDGAQTTLRFGASPYSYVFSLGATVAFLQSATNYNFYTSAGLTAVGHNFASPPITPAFVGLTTYARLQGTLSTYIQCHDISHATAPNEIWANVLDATSKRSIWLGATNGYYFGYNVSSPTLGIYFRATSAIACICHTSKDVFCYNGTTLTLSPGGSGVATNLQFSTSAYSVGFGGITKFSASVANTYCYCDTTTYMKVESKQITLSVSATDAHNLRVNQNGSGWGYLKLPMRNTIPQSPGDGELGAIIYGNFLYAGHYCLCVCTQSGWKYVELLP